MRTILATPALIILAGAASAQDADWRYKATIYGWFPGLDASVDTRFGTVESSSSTSDALSDLKMAFMGDFSAQHGRFGLLGDLLYTNLSSTQDTPFALYGDGTTDVKVTALSGYALYRISSDPRVDFDLGAGFRNFDAKLDVTLTPGIFGGASQSVNGNWTDPLIAARISAPIDDKWFAMGFADFGGTGSDDQTWQIYGGIGYAFNETWSTQLGYRYMSISKDLDGLDVSVDLSGPVLALSYNF